MRLPGWVRIISGPVILLLLTLWLNPDEVLARLVGLDLVWVGAALAVSVAQTALSAWRWQFTAERLGLRLSLGCACSEYYRGVFLNQVLPGGVLGDASRAWRHSSQTATEHGKGPAVRAVILERLSGQVLMAVVAAASFLTLAARGGEGARIWWVAACGVLLLVAGLIRASRPAVGRPASPWGALAADARQAIFARGAFRIQLVTSALIVGSYVLTYLLAARAVGSDAALWTLTPLVAPVLLAMLLPVSVAGWGIREGAAAAVWGAAGLGASEGVAISLTYGLVVLLGTMPGIVPLLTGIYASGDRPGSKGVKSRSKRISAPTSK